MQTSTLSAQSSTKDAPYGHSPYGAGMKEEQVPPWRGLELQSPATLDNSSLAFPEAILPRLLQQAASSSSVLGRYWVSAKAWFLRFCARLPCATVPLAADCAESRAPARA